MKFLPLLKTCIRALVRNPMRAALTILGIIIGIAAVIAMVEIGQGSTLQIKNITARSPLSVCRLESRFELSRMFSSAIAP